MAAAAAVLALLWDRLVQPHPPINLGLIRASLPAVPGDLRRISTEWIGVFGWASVRMPSWSYALIVLLVAALVIAALALARTARERLVASASLVVAVAFVALLDLIVFRQTYFPVYGRYLLPLGALVPLAAGHVVTRNAGRLTAQARRWAPLAAVSAVALVQLVGLWTSARRAAVSVEGPVWFFGQSQFAPPGGWEPWCLLAVLGTLALTACGIPRRRGVQDAVRAAASSASDPPKGPSTGVATRGAVRREEVR